MSTELAGSSIDREVALSRVGGDAELLREIAALFLDDYPKVMADLHDAAARGDASTVERTAHSLKGSVANFGAKSVMETALKIEDFGRNKQLVRRGTPASGPRARIGRDPPGTRGLINPRAESRLVRPGTWVTFKPGDIGDSLLTTVDRDGRGASPSALP